MAKISMTQAVEDLEASHPILAACGRAFRDEYGDEQLFVVLFGRYGSTVVEHWAELDMERRLDFFNLIDRLMVNGDEQVTAAVATGFLEAIQHRATDFPFREAAALLGPESRRYCEAYDRASGSETPGLNPD